MEKRCPACGHTKILSEYNKDKKKKDGLFYACKVCAKAASRKWKLDHAGQVKERTKKWNKKNKKYKDEYNKKWRLKNTGKVKIINQKADAKRRNTPKGKLNRSMSRRLSTSLRGVKSGHHWESLVGFTFEQLRKHLEKRFTPGMSWENYGSSWHIDHKIPISAFNFTRPEDVDFKRCWSLKNLQPLESKQNMIKGTKIERPFQPSLTL